MRICNLSNYDWATCRGLAASPGDYRWSSFNHYATGARGVVEIESEWTARLRGPLIAMKPR